MNDRDCPACGHPLHVGRCLEGDERCCALAAAMHMTKFNRGRVEEWYGWGCKRHGERMTMGKPCECVTTEGPLGEPQGLMPGLPAPEPPAALRPTLWGEP